MKKIGIDARLYFQTGVGVYIRNLLFYLQKISIRNFIFYIYLMKEDFAKVTFKDKNFIKRQANFRWHTLSEQTKFLNVLRQDNLDLAHFTYFGYPIFYRKKFITTIHDLTPILFKTGRASTKNPIIFSLKHFAFKNMVLSNQIKNSSMIITPTHTIKKQLITIFGEKYAKKIIPIYEGVNYELINKKKEKQIDKKKENNFFLYVGNFYPHKNVERLIQAFSRIESDIKLFLVGPNDFFTKRLFQLINQLKQEKRVIFFANPKPKDFVFFYKNAEALIHPSLSEGFGLPLVESMQFDLPIIASNIEVFKEILDDRYLSFNPYDAEDIKNKIEHFLKEKPTFNYKELLKRYSFEKMAEKTLEIYNRINI